MRLAAGGGLFVSLSSCEMIGQYFEHHRGNACSIAANERMEEGWKGIKTVKVRATVTEAGPLLCEFGAERYAMDSDGQQPSHKYGVYMAQSYEEEQKEAQEEGDKEQRKKSVADRKRMAQYQENRGVFIPACYKQRVTVKFTSDLNGRKEEKKISGLHTFDIGERSLSELHGGESGTALLDRRTQTILLRFEADKRQKLFLHKTTKNERESS